MVLLSRHGEQAHPDLTRERVRGQQVVGCLIILVTESALGFRLESMSFTAFGGLEATMESKPKEKF
jgi:hypothetical protein